MSQIVPRALTIAGSDSGGGAGIQADLKTFTAFRVFGMSVVTSVTAQNTQTVLGIYDMPADFIELQLDAVLKDIGVDAVKIGMLSNIAIVKAVAGKVKEYGLKRVILDPVMVAKGGYDLLHKDARDTLIGELLPQVHMVTPNLAEAEVISGIGISSLEDVRRACEVIKEKGPEYVLIKGGHFKNTPDAVDILFGGDEFLELKARRVDTKNTHGTGCTYSAAICAALARGVSTVDAVREAKGYVTTAIKKSFDLGRGHGPLNHFWKFE